MPDDAKEMGAFHEMLHWIKKAPQLLQNFEALSRSRLEQILIPLQLSQTEHMDIAHLIQTYGYFAVALGSFLEGEAVLLAGSLAAYQGHLSLPVVMGIATMASFAGDLPYFFAGRRYGPRVLQKFPSFQRKKDSLEKVMRKHHVVLVLSLRFLYGMRIAGLLALGMSKISAWRFLFLDFIGAIVWSAGICAAGYGAGGLFRRLLNKGATSEQVTLIAAILAGSLILWIARRRAAALRN